MADWGKAAAGAGAGAAAGSVLGPWGTAGGAVIGGLAGLLSGDGNNAAPAPPPSQYGGNPITDQLAAQQYAAGLQQQQAQNAREAAFYNNANGNFDIANAAQMRSGPQITSSPADIARQLTALRGTTSAIGNVNQTGQQLTALGTRPMGDSYAEAQLRQGQDAAMAQQLSMARSGRSLGSGQAALQQAMFNNAALNQQTNLAAANARIQEQNAYNQFQANALGQAGQQYGAAGALSGQAGGQATTIRQGNEGVQAQNANLNLQQQGVNNQTTGIYNQLGSQQQQLGMQANNAGQNAYQFGANQASGALGAQLNADTGRLSSTTATNIANQNNANAHDAANVNMAASGFGAAANAVADATSSGGGSAPSNPNGAFSNITASSHYTPSGAPSSNDQRLSDERQKKNIHPPMPVAANSKYSEFSPEDAAVYRAADIAAKNGQDTYTANGKTNVLRPHGDAPMDDENLGKIGVTGEEQAPVAGYAETIAALNNGYRASQFAPTDVLNHVPGAGAGYSGSQAALLAALSGKQAQAGRALGPNLGSVSDLEQGAFSGRSAVAQTESPASLASQMLVRGSPSPQSSVASNPVGSMKINTGGARISNAPAPVRAAPSPAPQAAWGDVFNAPTLDPRIQAYLNGANPSAVPASGQMHYSGAAPDSAYSTPNPIELNRGDDTSSDARSKTRIRELESQLAALKGPPSASFSPDAPDTAALDDSEYARQVRPGWRNRDQLAGPQSYPHRWDADPFATAPAVDLRAAPGYSYEYKDPGAPGAAPGRHVGPMAQDLERTAAASTVRDTPTGKQVDTGRLSLVNTAAISEQQRKTAELERQLAALQGVQPAAYDPSLYPNMRSPR